MTHRHEKHRTGSNPDDIVNSALELLGARAWPGPERNPRIEDYIMNESVGKRTTKRKLLIGGLLLLLGGTAIGAVTTTIITYRFTGVAVDTAGNRYDVEGDVQIEQSGDQQHATVRLEGLPPGPIQSGELKLEDGRVIQMVPIDGGASVTYPPEPAKVTEPAKPANPEKK